MQIKLTEIQTLVIGMISETQRNQHMENLCNRLGLQAKLIQSISCDPGYFGCTIGHLKALTWGRKSGKLPFLVMENDCDVTDFFRSEINVPADSDMVYLGNSSCGCVPALNYRGIRGCVLVEAVAGTSEFNRVKNMLACHAVLYTSQKVVDLAIASIVESISVSRAFDIGYVVDLQNSLNVYNTRLPWFFQSAKLQTKSDIAEVMQSMTLDEVPEPREVGTTMSYATDQPGTIIKLILSLSETGKEWISEKEQVMGETKTIVHEDGLVNLSTKANSSPDTINWNRAADALWKQGDRQGAINQILAVINANPSQIPRSTAMQFVYYLFQLQDYVTAEKVLSDLLGQNPADLEALENRAVMRIRINKTAEAVADFRQVVEHNPNAVNAWDGLANALYKLQRWPEAQYAGEQSLQRKDQMCKAADLAVDWPDVSPQVWDATQPGLDVIAFSLWGSNPRYLRGAVRNLQEASSVYPGWVCRFYVDDSVPIGFVNLAIELGAQVIQQPANQTVRQKLSWRFLVANDPMVRRFLVRDADSVVSLREAQAVAEWLASDRWFHVMRDYWTHTDLILAGMWGGRSGLLPDLAPLVVGYQSGRLETPNIDQWFLRDRVWPLIRSASLIHDRCFRVLDARVWPGADPVGNWHVGQDEAAARPQDQAHKLGDLVAKYVWLGVSGAPGR
jgi:tetratricopeptide (TPR) repeat protein